MSTGNDHDDNVDMKMKASKPAAATQTQVLRRAKELGVDVLDHEKTLWLFCPAGKVFDFGDAEYHYQVYAEMLKNLRVNAPTDCTDSECELCRFRRTLPSTSESLLALAQFFLKHDYSY
jgi:hypothetical protein